MLACRNCRRTIASTESCAICGPLKAQLVSSDETEDERPSLSDTGSEVVSELRYALKRARQVHRNDKAGEGDRLAAAGLIIKLANTLAKVLEAARKLQTDGIGAIRNMSFIERATLFLDWYIALAPTYRVKLREKMAAHEDQQNQAQLPAGDP